MSKGVNRPENLRHRFIQFARPSRLRRRRENRFAPSLLRRRERNFSRPHALSSFFSFFFQTHYPRCFKREADSLWISETSQYSIVLAHFTARLIDAQLHNYRESDYS